VTCRPRYWWSSVSLAAAFVASPSFADLPQADGTEAAAVFEAALLEVSVNGASMGEPVPMLKAPDGTLYAPETALAAWRLKHGAPSLTHEGKSYYALNAIPGVRFELVEATQTLLITAAPEMLERTQLAHATADIGPMTPRATGGFLNYELLGELADDSVSLNGAIEVGVFTPVGVGVSNFVGRWGGGRAEMIRLETNWTFDDPSRMRSLRFGDSISRGGVGGVPLRFGGLQLTRNFAVQPGFVTLPMPSIQGSAAVPSVVDIYVNNALRDSREVPPGPFEITNVPVVNGSGDVRLVVRDLLGRETLVSQSYYAAPQLLRRGLHDYSYEVGFLRRNFARESNDYGALMMSATHRYGFSSTLTGEAHVEATGDVQAGGLAASLLLPGIGLVDASVAASNSDRGEGAQVGLGFERRTPSLSFGVLAEFTTDDYVSVGWPSERLAPASTIRAFAGLPLSFGSLGLSYLRIDGRSEPDVEFLSANLSVRVGDFGTLYLAGRRSLRGPGGTAAELTMVIPLGRRTSASAGAELRDGRPSATAALQRNLPVGTGFGYRASMAVGAIDRFDGRLSAQADFGAYDADVTWVEGKAGIRIAASGGFGAVGDRVFASRKLNQSFATVQVGDYPDVRVYADNQLIGRTNGAGWVVIPRLRPYDRNVIRIEIADLPLDTDVDSAERTIRPYARSGVAVDFGANRSRGALLNILLEDGRSLPAGTAVRLEGGNEEFVSAPGGEVYLTGLNAENVAIATWSEGSCQVRFRFDETDDPQPRLGEFRCLRSSQ
jgi:outer membrane usher protein